MADTTDLLRASLALGDIVLLLVVAAFLTFTPPATRAKRAVALFLAVVALWDIVGAALEPLDPSPPAGFPFARAFVWHDLGHLMTLAVLPVFWFLPRPPPLRSAHTVAFAVVGGLFAASALVWAFARNLYYPEYPFWIYGFPDHLLWFITRHDTGALYFVLLASSLWRLRDEPPRTRNGLATLLVMVIAFQFATAGLRAAHPITLPGLVPILYNFDPCCAARSAFSVLQVVPFVALALWLSWRWRAHAATFLIVAVGGLLPPVLGSQGVDVYSAYFYFCALGPVYAMSRYGVLDAARVPPGAWQAVAAAFVLMISVSVTTSTILVFPGSQLAQALGILGGLALGLVAAYHATPPGTLPGTPSSAPPDERRLGAYRAALLTELDRGTGGSDLSTRLRPLRAELGVSEQEHALLEFALRGAARRPQRLGPGQHFLDRYRVERVLGKGASGTTYLCTDDRVGRPVVLKEVAVPPAEGVESALKEVRALGRLRHPNVVDIFDVQEVGDRLYLVMEHVEGGSLQERLRRGALAPQEFTRVARGLLAALEAVHGAGLVHRDVKPSNLLLTAQGEAKLADFGVARLPGLETTAVPGAQALAVGTVRYMSPEQAKGQSASARSDLYSAAVTLFEACTGRPYLEPKPNESAMELQLRAAFPPRFDAPIKPPALRSWFAKALQPTPEDRFGSAAEMARALQRALPPVAKRVPADEDTTSAGSAPA